MALSFPPNPVNGQKYVATNNTVYTYDVDKWIGTSNPAVTTVAPTGTAGTVTANAQPNITSTGTLVSLNVTGGVTAASFTGSHSGAGNNLSNIQGANVSGQVGNALVAGTVYTAAQPNITSVGTLTGLTSGGVVNLTTASNVSLGPVGNVKITGGTTGQVLSTNGSGTLSWISSPTPTSGVTTGTAAQDYQKAATAPTTRSTAGASAALVEGDMWYDTANDILMIRSGASSWISAGGTGGASVTVATTAPASPVTGGLWYNDTTGLLQIWNGTAWKLVNDWVVVSDTAPTTPFNGQLWYDSLTAYRTFVWSTQAGAWIDLCPAGGGTSGKVSAWVNFDGSTATINGSYNVSSVVRVSAGVYTVNFTTAVANANYAVSSTIRQADGAAAYGAAAMVFPFGGSGELTTTSCTARVGFKGNTLGLDSTLVCMSFFAN